MKKRLLAYLAGLPVGALAGLAVNYFVGKPLSPVFICNTGNIAGILAIAWAQHRGLVPSPEEASRPITLFPREKTN